MEFQEPRVEFVPIDMTMVTEESNDCTNSEFESSYDMCGCTNSAKKTLVGGDECSDIV